MAQVPLVYSVENSGSTCAQPPLPDASALPWVVRLPNPFEWSDGHGAVTNFSDWECRRNEIKAEIEHYEIGIKPPKPTDVTATYADGVLTVVVNENGHTVTLTSNIQVPTEGAGAFPVIIGMNSATGSIPSDLFDGFIKVPFMHDQSAYYSVPSGQTKADAPFFQMYPELVANGDYSAWAWGVSRLIDGLEIVASQINADLQHIGVTGCSYAGKMALFSGAFDERIALTIAQESGGGGTANWRVSETLGSVENIGSTNYSWFMQSLNDNFNGKAAKLPYDHHELLAMVAPRALLTFGNDGWTWMADESGYISCMAAYEVYKRFGVEDRFGWDFTGGHNHCQAPESQVAAAEAFINKFLRGDNTVDTDIHTSPYEERGVNYQFWISDWAEVTEPAVEVEQNWFEAESSTCAVIGNTLTISDDNTASPSHDGKFVTSATANTTAPDGSGLITIPFTVNN
ncbi:MAG: hypothetical protein LBB41_03900, partial [Prevotellaceae bacterium]|nr:hypothetical protein [Prevotellaceae bacterium]